MRAPLLALTILGLLLENATVSAQPAGHYPGHQAWAAYHINGLAPEIRSSVERFRQACGLPFAATHAFLRPTNPEASVVALHYEALWCQARGGGICRGGRCLHEVYERNGRHYRLIFRGYAREVEVDGKGRVSVIDRDG